jgi:uncharacterized protein YndB with AHSA1/START domain
MNSSLGESGGKGVIRLQERYDTDIDDLWSALTDPSRVARWLGTVEGDLRVGGEFRAVYFASGWEGSGRVEACEPPRRVLLSARGSDATETHMVELTLTAEGDHTVLVLETSGMPLDNVAGYGAGTQIHLEDLNAYLRGRGPCDARARFDELYPGYQAQAVEQAT